MYKNPYQIFGVDPDITSYDLRKILLDYKATAMGLNMLYAAYFTRLGPLSMHTENRSEMLEQILSKRYEFGLEFNQIPLAANEIPDFLGGIADLSGETFGKEGQLSTITSENVKKRVEMYMMSSFFTKEMQTKIENAIDVFDKDSNDPKDDSKMMDVLLAIRYGEIKLGIAKELARRVSENGLLIEENEFRRLLKDSLPYEQIQKIYEQVATKEKRDELVPELYVMRRMSDTSEVSIISDEAVQRLLNREQKYSDEYIRDIVERLENPTSSKDRPMLENQNHDYAWGMILTDPVVLMDDEPVNTPIFKGRIRVEDIGSFTEKSLFTKKRYVKETDRRVREDAKFDKKKSVLQKLTMSRGDKDKSRAPRTMREYFCLHEAMKNLSDHIWKVTKTDTEGRVGTYIIFTPVEYPGNRGSELFDFIKNIYLSDYMLDIAKKNGGYAGRIYRDEGGYSISSKFNHEEIASSVLFQQGQRGDILDCRSDGKVRYTDQTVQDFMNLINSKERGVRVKDE